ncbi:hypothetical protein SAMN05216252_111130 [Actinacidiphila glaucinigra]|uniref:Uncharacterized protein n=1 Tax=Actinacidiphila glaucinigra TaxID=235986 RepID=A0A239IV82_9ACTN|nr:hypothetical protein SAMN05216252_111130 [Actinacidiphila glaucinigra]
MEAFEGLMRRIAGRFARVEPRRRVRRLVLGLLSDLPRKNCWTLAEHAGDASPDGMQDLLHADRWRRPGCMASRHVGARTGHYLSVRLRAWSGSFIPWPAACTPLPTGCTLPRPDGHRRRTGCTGAWIALLDPPSRPTRPVTGFSTPPPTARWRAALRLGPRSRLCPAPAAGRPSDGEGVAEEKPAVVRAVGSAALRSQRGASLEDRDPPRAIAGRRGVSPIRRQRTGPDLSPHGGSCPKPLHRPED